MAYHKVSHKTNELSEFRLNGWSKGEKTGYDNLDEIFSLKKGYPLFVAGAPHAGKTEFILDMLVNTSLLHKWKHFIYLGENGEVEEIISEIAHKYIRKPFKGKEQYAMSESEKTQAEMWIEEHFVFLDDSEDYNLISFYTKVEQSEIEYGIKYDTTLFDPFNDLIDETSLHGGRDDKWLAHELKLVRRISKKNNRIDILINHIADVSPILDKSSGNRYIPPALPSEWSGGRTWWRRAFCMIMVYIPPFWMNDENGVPYGENVSLIYIQKAKPKGVAKLGKCTLYWDWKTNRYYDRPLHTPRAFNNIPQSHFEAEKSIEQDPIPF